MIGARPPSIVPPMTQRPVLAYTLLLLVQTICALVILFHIHSTFRILVERIGQQQTLPEIGRAHV